MFNEELPPAVYEELDRRGLNGVPVLLSTTSELSLSGQPERHWIVATRQNVATVSDAEAPTVETHVPVADVREFRTQGPSAPGFLQAYVDDHWVDLARFPNAEADRSAAWHATWKTCARAARCTSRTTSPRRSRTARNAASGCRWRTKPARAAFRGRRSSPGSARCSGRTG